LLSVAEVVVEEGYLAAVVQVVLYKDKHLCLLDHTL
jgi:hypothetical protein